MVVLTLLNPGFCGRGFSAYSSIKYFEWFDSCFLNLCSFYSFFCFCNLFLNDDSKILSRQGALPSKLYHWREFWISGRNIQFFGRFLDMWFQFPGFLNTSPDSNCSIFLEYCEFFKNWKTFYKFRADSRQKKSKYLDKWLKADGPLANNSTIDIVRLESDSV